MENILTSIDQYMTTGGVTMYPLILCCLWMWFVIINHLPLWDGKPDREAHRVRTTFLQFRTGYRRYDQILLDSLQIHYSQKKKQIIATIKTLAAIAPLLGLFGTVTGMIKTFQSVAQFGLANPKAMAAGISEAMITTQFGLLIAVPGILAVVFLKRSVLHRQEKIEQRTSRLRIERGERCADAEPL